MTITIVINPTDCRRAVALVAAYNAGRTDGISDAQGLALAANVDTSKLKWVFRSREFVALRKLKDGDDATSCSPTRPSLDRSFCSGSRSL